MLLLAMCVVSWSGLRKKRQVERARLLEDKHITDLVEMELIGIANSDYDVIGISFPQAPTIDASPPSKFPELTNDHLKVIGSLPKLEEAYLDGTGITDQGLQHLSGLVELRLLTLSRTQISDVGTGAIANLPSLESLDLSDTEITNRGLAVLRRLPKLRNLSIHRTNVTADGLVVLRDIRNLERLSVSASILSAQAISELAAVPNLDTLVIPEINQVSGSITDEKIDEMHDALPDCWIGGDDAMYLSRWDLWRYRYAPSFVFVTAPGAEAPELRRDEFGYLEVIWD